jgi:hypothetical protein
MARVYDSLLSGVVGKVGRLVVVNRQGMEYVRLQPRTKSAPPSPKQQLVQLRLKKAMEFISPYKAYACKHFGKREGHKNQYNRALNNLLNSFLLDYQNFTISVNYPNLAFSLGDLSPISEATMSKPNPQTLIISWQNTPITTNNQPTDNLQLLITPDNTFQSYFFENLTGRAAEQFTLALPTNLLNKTLHLYAAFQNLDGTQVSNSTYLGSIS